MLFIFELLVFAAVGGSASCENDMLKNRQEMATKTIFFINKFKLANVFVTGLKKG